jgi:hypothetical protein
MRIRRRSAVILALGLAGALAVAGIALAANVSTLDFKFTDSKVPKNNFEKGKLFVHVTTLDAANPAAQPVPTTNVNLDIDDDIKFKPGVVPQCTTSLAGTTTGQARNGPCANSLVGKGEATARFSSGPDAPACVSDFRGPTSGAGNPTILLHTRLGATPPACTGGSLTIVLTGELRSSNLGGDFGKELNVPVPPTGAALIDFESTIKKGKFVAARCHDGNKRWNMRAEFDYSGTEPTDNVSDKQRCRRQ